MCFCYALMSSDSERMIFLYYFRSLVYCRDYDSVVLYRDGSR